MDVDIARSKERRRFPKNSYSHKVLFALMGDQRIIFDNTPE